MWVVPYPLIDPVILPLWGPLALRWYGLAYAAAVMFGYFYIPFWAARAPQPLAKAMVQEAVTQALLWAIVGGRLGYMLFYDFAHIQADPWVLWRLWEGGMSFHGGLIGVGLGLGWFARRHRLTWRLLGDLFSLAAPIGLMCGRIANFINGELYGRITDVPWAMVFPQGGPWPRHPSQLYEAIAEGLALFLLLNGLAVGTGIRHFPGALTGVFLSGYGVARFATEFFREPSVIYAWLPSWMTWGQLLSLPLILGGVWMLFQSLMSPKAS